MSLGVDVFGREAELSVVKGFLGDVREGPAALLLEGDAGVGKTTLWKVGVEDARLRSFRVLTCRPVESETRLSFASLGDLFGGTIDETEVSLPEPQARALDVALLRAEPEGAPPDNRAVSLAVLELLRTLSRASPVILALDDVQWLDAPTSRVLEFALRRLETEPVGVLATIRAGDETSVPFGLDHFVVESRFRRLDVGPLTVDALGSLLRARLGAGFLRPTLVRLHEMSGGNPFFAIEIARASLRGDKPAMGQLLPVPQGLRDLVRRRVAALPAGSREALLVAAAVYSPTIDLVQEAIGGGADDALAAGVEAGVVEIDEGQVRFTHPLFGSVIFSEATSGQRRLLHQRLAGVLTDPEERARHLALGADGPNEHVATALDEAAQRARARGAPDAAGELSEMAMRLTPADRADELGERSLRAANHYAAAGETARARALLETEVDRASPGPFTALALRRLASVRAEEEGWTTAIPLFLRARDEAGPYPALRGSIEQGLAYAELFLGDLTGAERHARSALDLAEQGGDPAVIAEALQFVVYLDFIRGRGPGWELLERGIALEGQTGELRMLNVLPSYTRAQLLVYTERFDTARSAFLGLLEQSQERGQEHPIPMLLYHLAELECWAGNWDVAERHARASLDAALQTGLDFYRSMALYANALVDALRGRVEQARSAAMQGVQLAERVGSPTTQIQNLSVLGFLDLFMGNPAGAHHHLGRAADMVAGMGIEEPGVFRFIPDEVEALVALGDLEAATALLDPFEERARRLDRGWALATGARCRGLLLAASGDLDGALEALARALEHHAGVPEPFALARTWFAQGRVQRRAKRKREARESFERALEIFRRLGAEPWAERAGREARRVGVTTPDRFALTATEERVASLVAQGNTNQEVAAALFMSVNTVQWNLSKIYRKLGVRSRTELAARLGAGEGSG
ncbi:MAG: tetratricopeptide repeat protein [Actinomycetota bacterium]|nr:tetratricopeptide repeat protein [Actinomycetota bacterium]